MSTTTTPTLASLIDETLDLLSSPGERPLQTAVGSDSLTASASDTTLTLASGSLVAETDLLEIGQELLLVTAKSADATPVFTVARGYLGTPVTAHATGDVVLKAPAWPRHKVRRSILRGLRGAITTQLPYITQSALTPISTLGYVSVPADTIEVFRLSYIDATAKRWVELSQWEFVEDLPTSEVSTGKLITLPRGLPVGQPLQMVYQAPYVFSGGTDDPAEAETIKLPHGAEDLPSLYAAAFLLGGREISRMDLDRVEEWNHEEAIRQGANLRALQFRWQEFYRRLDEVRRVQNVPKKRVYKVMRGLRRSAR